MAQTIEERIESLERQNRRLKLVGGSTIGIVLLVAVFGQATSQPTTSSSWWDTKPDPRVLEAGAFVLLDEHGKKRAELGVFYGTPIMYFYDESGNSRLIISYNSVEGPMIEFLGPLRNASEITFRFRRCS